MPQIKMYAVLLVLICANAVVKNSAESIPSEYEDMEKCLVVLMDGPLKNVCHHDAQGQCEKSDKTDTATAPQLRCANLHKSLSAAFSNEESVVFVNYTKTLPSWVHEPLGKNSLTGNIFCSMMIYAKQKKDRTCLISPTQKSTLEPAMIVLKTVDGSIGEVNKLCNTFRNVHGSLNSQGLHQSYIMENLFSVKSIDQHVKAEDVFGCDGSEKLHPDTLPRCERVSITSWHQFYHEYLQTSRPVIVTNAMAEWKATFRWTKDFLKEKYGNKSVHIKLSPTSDYEGIERAELWDDFKSLKIPSSVFSQLEFPDLVVPRPAPSNMKFAEYLDLMENIATGRLSNVSAYLEYSSIRQYFPALEDDIKEMPFLRDQLKLRHLNIWLSDGNTLGKLHFDPFDNFLCMLDGRKELILFEPYDNQMLYEAHIPEAEFSVDLKNFTFRRRKLLESTSMVMSPFDIRKPDFERSPLFRDTFPLNCTIGEGEALFMPAFWWHEVQSYPNLTSKRNLAVNFWYEPFLTKEFPCKECKLYVNPFYHHLL